MGPLIDWQPCTARSPADLSRAAAHRSLPDAWQRSAASTPECVARRRLLEQHDCSLAADPRLNSGGLVEEDFLELKLGTARRAVHESGRMQAERQHACGCRPGLVPRRLGWQLLFESVGRSDWPPRAALHRALGVDAPPPRRSGGFAAERRWPAPRSGILDHADATPPACGSHVGGLTLHGR